MLAVLGLGLALGAGLGLSSPGGGGTLGLFVGFGQLALVLAVIPLVAMSYARQLGSALSFAAASLAGACSALLFAGMAPLTALALSFAAFMAALLLSPALLLFRLAARRGGDHAS